MALRARPAPLAWFSRMTSRQHPPAAPRKESPAKAAAREGKVQLSGYNPRGLQAPARHPRGAGRNYHPVDR
jgi:hypothetical protein